jgi:hypothetical protein
LLYAPCVSSRLSLSATAIFQKQDQVEPMDAVPAARIPLSQSQGVVLDAHARVRRVRESASMAGE